MQITDLRTPCVLVDHLRVERNIERMQAAADARGVRLRPHAKTHKCPDLARVQVGRGAIGICCAKLGEAEVFADAGIADIRLPYPLNPVNADRVLRLLDRTHVSFIVDHMDVARGWSDAMTGSGREVDVLVKVDTGSNRVVQRLAVGRGPAGLVTDGDSLWVALELEGKVVRLDPATGAVRQEIVVGGRPTELAVADGAVWVAVDERS